MTQQPAIDVSPEEEDFGFTATETAAGVHAVIAPLPDGLRAIKRRAPDGSVHYDVCDESLQPLYAAANTVEELRRRFLRPSGM